MDLLDLVEMSFDWLAASKRHSTGNVERSIEINAERFNYGPLLINILKNTLVRNSK